MPSVAEILAQTGFTKEQIDALDPKMITAFGSVLTASEQKEQAALKAAQDAEVARVAAKTSQDATELERRSLSEFYDTKVMPGLVGFEEEKKQLETARINAESKATFYETQIKGLKDAGFLPADSPAFVVPNPVNNGNGNNGTRDGQGRFVAGTSGSPTFDPGQLTAKVGDAYNTINDIMYEHQVLFGKPLPIPPSQLIAQADALKLSPAAYAERTFNFTAKKQEMAEVQRKEHDAQVAKQASDARDAEHKIEVEKMRSEFEAQKKKMAEGAGNNPEIRVAVSSKLPEVARATKAGERKDPLKMTDNERRVYTRQMIHKDIEENAHAVA